MDCQEPKWQEPPKVWCDKGQWYVRPDYSFTPFKCSKSLAIVWKKRLRLK